jgi:hypothetical protein
MMDAQNVTGARVYGFVNMFATTGGYESFRVRSRSCQGSGQE